MTGLFKLVAAGAALSLLAGCAMNPPVDVNVKPIKKVITQPARPEPINLSKVTFKVVTKDTLAAFIAEQSKLQGTDNPVFIAISVKTYESLSLNLAELKRYIDQQQKIIIYYESATTN